MMFTLVSNKTDRWWLLAGLIASLLLCVALPDAWGWENGHLENIQALILLLGLLFAIWASWAQRHRSTGVIWRIAAIFWLCMLGRELAWGAVFYPPLGFDVQAAPIYSSSVLWFKPAVKWACAALLMLCIFWAVRGKTVRHVVWPWLYQRTMPWSYLALFAFAMVLSAHAEGNLQLPLLSQVLTTGTVAEEMAECWAYLALWCAQWHLIARTTARASAYSTPPYLVDLELGMAKSQRRRSA